MFKYIDILCHFQGRINSSPLAPSLCGGNIPVSSSGLFEIHSTLLCDRYSLQQNARTSICNFVPLASLPSALLSSCLVIFGTPFCLLVFEILSLASLEFCVWLFCVLDLVIGTS